VAEAQTPDPPPNPDAPALPDSEVTAAIALGRSSEGPFGYFAMSGTTLQVLALGPRSRIAAAAAKAKKMYLPYTPESVSVALRAPVLVVSASPRPYRGTVAFRVIHVIIQGREAAGSELQTMQPLRVDTIPRTWSNAFGAQVVEQDLSAYFNTSVLSLGDLTIVVVTSMGEARFKVREKDRDRLR
jgi:hypothetical protein